MAEDKLRLDKWLWHARVVKTRPDAQALIERGRVRVNRQKTDASHKPVRIGDTLTITLPHRVLVLQVLGLGTRRGPASEARLLYDDLSPPAPPRPTDATWPAVVGNTGDNDDADTD